MRGVGHSERGWDRLLHRALVPAGQSCKVLKCRVTDREHLYSLGLRKRNAQLEGICSGRLTVKFPSTRHLCKPLFEELLTERGREDALDGDEGNTSELKRPHGDDNDLSHSSSSLYSFRYISRGLVKNIVSRYRRGLHMAWLSFR